MSRKRRITRREFLKDSTAKTITVAGVASGVGCEKIGPLLAQPAMDRHAIIAALGDTLIPTAPGYPGYKRLETYGISKEVLKGLEEFTALDTFNAASRRFFGGKTFLELDEQQRADYLQLILDGSKVSDKKVLAVLRKVYRLMRVRIFTVFYQNFPQSKVARNKDGTPILKPGDQHQIINPNTKDLITGWDVANFRGPLTWEEEEQRRARFRKIHWHEN